MAIIKCPECGKQISDKAPTCPNCGVQIAGKLTLCANCGNIYFEEDRICPVCHHPAKHNRKPDARDGKENTVVNPAAAVTADAARASVNGDRKKPKKKNHTTVIVLLTVVGLIVATALYVSNDWKSDKETRAYEMAMKSEDVHLLENFLVNFPNASRERQDSIRAHIEKYKRAMEEWNIALSSRSKVSLRDYLAKYPNTKYKAVIDNMIDSIDWAQASLANNVDLYQQYINEHPYGNHAEEAKTAIDNIKMKTVSQNERQTIDRVLTAFFRSVNARDEERLIETLNTPMTSFLTLSGPTDSDVAEWMRRQYKDNVKDILWRIDHKYEVAKREVGSQIYEYNVTFGGTEEVSFTDGKATVTNNYCIKAVVSPDGKISAMSMNKLVYNNAE